MAFHLVLWTLTMESHQSLTESKLVQRDIKGRIKTQPTYHSIPNSHCIAAMKHNVHRHQGWLMEHGTRGR
jgi:hypothetical protein